MSNGEKFTDRTSQPLALLPGSSFEIPFRIPDQIHAFVNQRNAMVRVILSYRGATERVYKSDQVFRYTGPQNMQFSPVESRMN